MYIYHNVIYFREDLRYISDPRKVSIILNRHKIKLKRNENFLYKIQYEISLKFPHEFRNESCGQTVGWTLPANSMFILYPSCQWRILYFISSTERVNACQTAQNHEQFDGKVRKSGNYTRPSLKSWSPDHTLLFLYDAFFGCRFTESANHTTTNSFMI